MSMTQTQTSAEKVIKIKKHDKLMALFLPRGERGEGPLQITHI